MEDDTPVPSYRLTLTGGGLNLERQIGESEALSIVSIVMGGRRGDAPLRDGGSTTSDAPTGLTEGEYLEQSGADKYPEKMLALGAYIEDELGQVSFTRNDVREAFERAREPLPGNFARDFGVALSNRWIAEVRGSKDDFHVTGTGKKIVNAKFAADARPTTRPRRRRRARPGNGDGQADE